MNKYTMEEFAELAGISAKFLSNVERGKQGFSGETLYRIAEALHVRCDYIVKENSESMYSDELIEVIHLFDESERITLAKILRYIHEMGS